MNKNKLSIPETFMSRHLYCVTRRCSHLGIASPITAALALLLISTVSSGQEKKRNVVAVEQNPYDNNNPPTTKTEEKDHQQVELLRRLETVEKKADAALKADEKFESALQKQEAENKQAAEIHEELIQHTTQIDEANLERIQEEEMALKVYGFADVQWYKFFYRDSAMYNGYLNKNNTFAVGHWHLYLEKRLSESFRFLGEARLLLQPYGEEISWASETGADGSSEEFERANTTATDWVDAYYFDWGGISIQRLWIEYKYSDIFGVRAGNFLTPYGLWNVDHASTVVIPAHRPFFITSKLLPESQTGLNFFGRFFPSDSTSIDYALTLSNGRGPTAKLYDLDENKAVGLSLVFSYDGPIHLNFGTYLFIGEYTEVSKGVATNPTNGGWDFTTDIVENYIEKSMSFHLRFDWKGLMLQGEYVRGLVRFKRGGRPTDAFTPTFYLPDYVQYAWYALIAYRLPIDIINLRPYFIFEYQKPSDASDYPAGPNYGGGLNWQITPAVVWKIECYYHQEVDDRVRWGYSGKDLNYGVVTSQLAVSY